MKRVFLVGLLALALSACATAPSARTYSGTWNWQFETSSFTSHDGQGPYWLTPEGDTAQALTAPLQHTGGPPWGTVDIVVEGTLSPEGHYGHMGAYSRELHVTRVISARLIQAAPAPQGS